MRSVATPCIALEHGCAIRDPLSGDWSVGESGDFTFGDVLAARAVFS